MKICICVTQGYDYIRTTCDIGVVLLYVPNCKKCILPGLTVAISQIKWSQKVMCQTLELSNAIITNTFSSVLFACAKYCNHIINALKFNHLSNWL